METDSSEFYLESVEKERRGRSHVLGNSSGE